MTEFKIKARELSIDSCGYHFLCAFGKHINGGWMAIINWGISAELSGFEGDESVNTGKIFEALERTDIKNAELRKNIAETISNIITPLMAEMCKNQQDEIFEILRKSGFVETAGGNEKC